MMEKQQWAIPKLDPRLFAGYNEKGNLQTERIMESPNVPVIEEIFRGKDRGMEGGIYRKLKGVPFLAKCFPDPDILNKLNVVKADILSYFIGFSTKGSFLSLLVFFAQPFKKWKLETINLILGTFMLKTTRILRVDLSNCSYSCYFEDKSLYCDFGRELLKFLTIFLEELGIIKDWAIGIAETFALFVEYDDYYRLVMQDVFSETTKEKIQKPKELRRLGKILKQRAKNVSISPKMQALVNLLSFALWLPSVRKAFKKALNEIRFEKFQLDKADRYSCLTWATYDFFGQSGEQRRKEFMEIHKNEMPERKTLKQVKI